MIYHRCAPYFWFNWCSKHLLFHRMISSWFYLYLRNIWSSEDYVNSACLNDLIWSHMAYQIMHKNCKQYYVGAKRIIININTLRSSYCWRYDAFLSFQNMMFLYIFCALFIKHSMLLLVTVSTYKNVCGYFRLIWRCQCIKGCATIPINAHLTCALSHDSEKKYLDLYTEKEYVYF